MDTTSNPNRRDEGKPRRLEQLRAILDLVLYVFGIVDVVKVVAEAIFAIF